MNKFLLLVLLIVCSITSYAQITFEPGYFIDNDGNRVNCLIRNTDKLINPIKFEYRLPGATEVKIALLNDVQEFEILNTIHKYRRFTVEIDEATNNIKELSYTREPNFRKEQLFLRVLIEGKASLYSYTSPGNLERYFYSKENSDVKQLIYKQYLITESVIGENNSYKQQLIEDLDCPNFTFALLEKIKYKDGELIQLIADYNECVNASYTNHADKKLKGRFNFSVKAGVNSASLKVDQYLVIEQAIYGTSKMSVTKHATTYLEQKFSPRVGFEIERVFAFNKYKWSLFVEPAFQYYKAKDDFVVYRRVYVPETITHDGYYTLGEETGILTVDYTHIAIPLGIRHYFYLNDDSKLLLSGALSANFLIHPSSSFKAEGYTNKPEFEQYRFNLKPSFIVGLGYKIKDKFGIELNYDAGKRMLENNSWETKFSNSFSVVLSHKLY